MKIELCKISNDALAEKLSLAVREERRLTVEVLHLLREVERRELFARLGFSSLFSYCVDHSKYSESAAQRRIVAMRALRELPELEEKIETGKLSLSVLAMTESSLKQNAKRENRKVSIDERRTVLAAVEDLSRRKAELALIEKFDLAPMKFESTEQPLNNGGARIVLELTEDEMQSIDELRRLSSQPQTAKELILRLVRAESARKKRQRGEAPLLGNRKPSFKDETRLKLEGANLKKFTSAGGSDSAERKRGSDSVARERLGESKNELHQKAPEMKSLPLATKRLAWVRAESRCEFRTANGSRCFSKHTLEFDHVKPRAHGGSDEPNNLRLLCRAHHRLLTTDIFGRSKMQPFRPTISPLVSAPHPLPAIPLLLDRATSAGGS